MKKKRKSEMDDELRPEYDLHELLKGGVRGKYAERYRAGTNLVLLAPDVAKAFRQNAAPRKIVVQVPQVLVRVCENVFVPCGDASREHRPARPLRGAVASVPAWARANLELQVIKQ